MGTSTRSLVFAALAALSSSACESSGCSKLEPIPGGFPSAERIPNAAQMRVSTTGFDEMEANPVPFAQRVLGPTLQAKVPPSCTGTPPICCPGGTPSANCGPIAFDPAPKTNDDARLILTPVQGGSRIAMTMRFRLKTVADLPVTILGANCLMRIDTAPGAFPDVQLDAPIQFVQDATAGTTRVAIGDPSLSRLTGDDITLSGGFACSISSFDIGSMIDTLTRTLADAMTSSLQKSFCKPCANGAVASCGPFATACTSGICMIGDQCLQEIGPTGRMSSAALFGGAPPGSAGALDVHEIAGGYATTNSGGTALGVLGGQLPAGTPHDRCGPPATAPANSAIPLSAFFQGNTRPDTGGAFDFALGVHVSQVQRLAYAAYQGGVLCTTVDTRSLPTLTSNAFSSVTPSLGNLTRGDRPVWIGFRPQSPPTPTFGANAFDAGAVTDPLIALAFPQAEMDVFAEVERQPIRVATIAGDLNVPLGVKSDAPGTLTVVPGQLTPPANVTAKNHAPLLESSAALAALAPILQNAIVPEMMRRVNPIPLPRVAGFAVTPTAITTVDNNAFIAVFGDLAPAPDAGVTASLPGPAPASGSAAGGSAPSSLPTHGPSPFTFFACGALAALAVASLVARRRRGLRVWGALTVSAAVATLLGPASCGSDDAGSASGSTSGGPTTDSGGEVDRDGAVECVPAPCQSGDLVPNLGEWNAVATSGARTVIATYDAEYGDAVLVEVAGTNQTRRAIDGVPNDPPTHAPSGYRGGVQAPGPNVGAWPTVAFAGDRVLVAHQARDRGALRFAREEADNRFVAHDVDAPNAVGVEAGVFASLAMSATPAIAHVVRGLPGDNGAKKSELRFARAKSVTPSQPSDWTTTVVATADIAHTRMVALADGRFVIAYYDRARTALIVAVENAAGASQFSEVVLDGGDANDRGEWATAVVDGSGVIHVAYTDAITRQVFALRFTPGSAPSAPELVDDGMRQGDRAHWVGAGLAAWLDGTTFRVAYQDAMTADVVVASRTGDTWTHSDLITGAALDGFALAAPASGKGPLVWDRLDSNSATSHSLTIHAMP